MASKPDVDFAIVGGGPGGLAMAKALMNALPGRSVQVFEAAAGYRPQGAGVLIEVNGWRALHAIDDDMAQKMRAGGILLQGANFYDEQGNQQPFKLPNQHERNVKELGHTQVMVHWGDIREILYSALPQGTVQFSTRVTGITPGTPGGEPAKVTVEAKGAEPRSLSAGLVIASDGYFSRTRRMVFGPEGLPLFRDKVVWRALVAYSNQDDIPQVLREHPHDSMWYMPPGVKTPPRTALVYPVGGGRFVWTCVATVADIEAATGQSWTKAKGDDDLGIQMTGRVGASAKQRCLAVFAKHPHAILDLLQRTDEGIITEHGYYTHDFPAIKGEASWVRGNVVLVGDAAHTGPPDGQGLNMAWEDCATLAACLRDEPDAQKALSAYCAARLPRVMGMWSESDTIVKPMRGQTVNQASFKALGADRGKSVPPAGSGADAPMTVITVDKA